MRLFPEKKILVLKFAHFSSFLHKFFQMGIFEMKIRAPRRHLTKFCHFKIMFVMSNTLTNIFVIFQFIIAGS